MSFSVVEPTVSSKPPSVVRSAKHAIELIDDAERTCRSAAVSAVDVMQQLHESRVYYDQGHANARIMYQHIAGVSGSQSHRLDKIRRMIAEAELIAVEWRNSRLSVDKAALIAHAFANPRTRDRFLIDQRWFVKKARRFGFARFKKIVARWIEVHDVDGSPPDADPSFERRTGSFVQDGISKAWKLEVTMGSMQGSRFNEVLRAYLQAEFLRDWADAEREHGDATCHDLLARTHRQRMVDALEQMAEDAANSDKASAPVKRVHNIVWTAEAYEELLARWVNSSARMLDPDSYNICDIDGHPIAACAAFADSLVQSLRRVVQTAAGVTINLSAETRFFRGLSRLGVQLTTTECYWPGCNVPTSGCDIEHLRPAARGGLSEQLNGLPACRRHNLVKERGYTVTRQPDGTVIIKTPTGELVH